MVSVYSNLTKQSHPLVHPLSSLRMMLLNLPSVHINKSISSTLEQTHLLQHTAQHSWKASSPCTAPELQPWNIETGKWLSAVSGHEIGAEAHVTAGGFTEITKFHINIFCRSVWKAESPAANIINRTDVSVTAGWWGQDKTDGLRNEVMEVLSYCTVVCCLIMNKLFKKKRNEMRWHWHNVRQMNEGKHQCNNHNRVQNWSARHVKACHPGLRGHWWTLTDFKDFSIKK